MAGIAPAGRMLSAETRMRPVADVESGARAGRIGRLSSLVIIYVCGGSVNKVTVIDTPRIKGLKLAILGVIN